LAIYPNAKEGLPPDWGRHSKFWYLYVPVCTGPITGHSHLQGSHCRLSPFFVKVFCQLISWSCELDRF
jgi:hypothetical protein